jgi:hypothetical protein
MKKFHDSGLDAGGEYAWIPVMKTKVLAGLIGALLVGAGCVSTVDDRHRAGMPFTKDKFEGRYERSVDQVFQAAKQVMADNGVLANDSTLYNQGNVVRTVEGKVNQRSIWVRIEGIDPKITSVIVQARTRGGFADVDLAHELEKQIALKLTR